MSPGLDMQAMRAGIVCFALQLLLVASAGAWETEFDDGEVRVGQRDFSGSALREVRGETRVAASLNAVMALLRDADYNHAWVYRSGGARVLQAHDYEQAYVYGIVDAPWPMQDRDTIVRFDFRQDPETLVINVAIKNFPDFLPVKPGLVRVPEFRGFWRLEPLANCEVMVTYQVHGEPGGWVPVWLANYAAVTSVTRTLRQLPAAVAAYRGARAAQVRELSATESPCP